MVGDLTICKFVSLELKLILPLTMQLGPVPRNDLIKIEAAFSRYTDKETITYYEYLNTMQDLRKEVSVFSLFTQAFVRMISAGNYSILFTHQTGRGFRGKSPDKCRLQFRYRATCSDEGYEDA